MPAVRLDRPPRELDATVHCGDEDADIARQLNERCAIPAESVRMPHFVQLRRSETVRRRQRSLLVSEKKNAFDDGNCANGPHSGSGLRVSPLRRTVDVTRQRTQIS